jgi:hypothetical protein
MRAYKKIQNVENFNKGTVYRTPTKDESYTRSIKYLK